VNNAIKFTEQGHVYVNISLADRDGRPFVRFDVEDTAIGIPAEKLRAIFTSFTQADGNNSRRYERHSQLFHNAALPCVKPVKNNFFSCANSMFTGTSIEWKRNSVKDV